MPVPAVSMPEPVTSLEMIGLRIQKLRMEKGWTQERLAQRCGLSKRTVIEIEKGNGARLDKLLPVLNELRLSLDVAEWGQCHHDFETKCRHCGAVAS